MRGRHITTGITLVVLCGVLVAAVIVGVNFLFAKTPSPSALMATPASPTCTPQSVPPGSRIRAGQVEVSVFNAGSRSGLAGKTLAQLSRRGFHSGGVGNAPRHVHVRRVQVWTSKKHDPAARLVARQFGRHVQVKVTGVSLGPGITVVVGDHFHGLVKAPHSLKVRRHVQLCASNAAAGSGS